MISAAGGTIRADPGEDGAKRRCDVEGEGNREDTQVAVTDLSHFVCSHDLDQNQITQLLNVTPSATGRTGASRRVSKGQKSAPLKAGVSRYRISGTDAEQIVDQFLARLGRCDRLLHSRPHVEEATIAFSISMVTNEGNGECSFALSSAQNQALPSCGVPLRSPSTASVLTTWQGWSRRRGRPDAHGW